MPLDRRETNSGAWSSRPPHQSGPQLPAFCRSHRPTVMVTASSLIWLRGLVLLGLAFQLSTCCLCSPGRCRRGQSPAPAPSSAPMPAGMPLRSHPSHRFQTDEHHDDDVIPFRCTCRLDESPCFGLPLLERHADFSAHHRRLRQRHSHVQGEREAMVKYRESDRCQTYLDALAENLRNSDV